MGDKLHEVRDADGNRSWFFRCPGCDAAGIGGVHRCDERWTWNGSVTAPSFNSSVLARCTWGEERVEHVCHSFVKDGRIQYLSDCTHTLAGQTVDLPDWEVTPSESGA